LDHNYASFEGAMHGMTSTQTFPARSAEAKFNGLKVLLVEDEALVAMLVEELLGELGCEVGSVATSVAEGMSRIEAGLDFDVAILDVNLSGEKSFPIADALIARDCPFLFATGFAPTDIMQRFPGIRLLLKPYSAQGLARSLEALVGRESGTA
jgi:CheY-like chemotaxis protein